MPTPFTRSLKLDKTSIEKTVKHQIRLGLDGALVGGTCGEGPLLTRKTFRSLTEKVCESSNGHITIGVQVTDNSFSKVLKHIENAKKDGADIVFVSEPWFKPARIGADFYERYYRQVIENSCLPVGLYIREILLSVDTYYSLLSHPNVHILKDSSRNQALKKMVFERTQESDKLFLTGDEFAIMDYMRNGYSGVLAGSGTLTGYLIKEMLAAFEKSDIPKSENLENLCHNIMYTVYGGEKLVSTLSGLKHSLKCLGIFETTAGYIKYPLPESVIHNIEEIVVNQKKYLYPY